MAYNPTNWKSGDVVTAEKLNNIESGIVESNVIPVITFTAPGTSPDSPRTCDKTFEELCEMGYQAVVRTTDETGSYYVYEIGELELDAIDADAMYIHCVRFMYLDDPSGLQVSGSIYTVADDNTVTVEQIHGFIQLS